MLDRRLIAWTALPPLFGFLRSEGFLITTVTMATGTSTSASLRDYSYKVRQPKRTIRYIQTRDDALRESRASAIALQGSFLGLDTEWKPNQFKGEPERPVALIQLASRHEVLLFHISRIGESVWSRVLFDGIILNARVLSRSASTCPHGFT